MAVGDITKIPAGGIQLDKEPLCVGGTTTTMYFGDDRGRVKSVTTSGVVAELTTKCMVAEKLAAVLYTSSALCLVTENGKVYTVGTDGSSLTKIADLQTKVKCAYYYSSYIYCFLEGIRQGGSSIVKVQIA